jgi:predicted Zn finger-like uncharacterized protein
MPVDRRDDTHAQGAIMPIAIACPSCSGKFKAPDNAAGRTVKCPKCGSTIDVPDALSELDDLPTKSQGKRPARSRTASEVDESGSSGNDGPTPGGKPHRTARALAIGGVGVLVLILIGIAILAFGRRDTKNHPGDDPRPAAQANGPSGNGGTQVPEKAAKQGGGGTNASSSRPTEEEARSKLKLALNSWVFGDSPEKFRTDHPTIRLGVRLHGLDKLARYDIGAARQTALGYEFAVTHVFENKAGQEIRRSGKVAVARFEGDQWFIQGLGGDD